MHATSASLLLHAIMADSVMDATAAGLPQRQSWATPGAPDAAWDVHVGNSRYNVTALKSCRGIPVGVHLLL
jgi:hypothetical protein